MNNAVLVAPPPPVLTIRPAPTNSVQLLWQTNDPSFVLQFNTDLGTTNWTFLTNPVVVLGTNNAVTDAATNAQNYYRLIRN